jgi:regulator of RNase E activity RraA
LHFACSSPFIPFLSSLAPHDTYKINKQGSNLRFDSTLLGYKKLKSIRGNITVLFKGRTPKGQEKDPNEGELLVIDHDKKTVCSIFEDAMASAKLQRDIDNIIDGEHV